MENEIKRLEKNRSVTIVVMLVIMLIASGVYFKVSKYGKE